MYVGRHICMYVCMYLASDEYAHARTHAHTHTHITDPYPRFMLPIIEVAERSQIC